MINSGNISSARQILFSSSPWDRNQNRGSAAFRVFCALNSLPEFQRAPLARLLSPCPSCPRAPLPSDGVSGAAIPAGLAFQNKGCVLSVCLSRKGCARCSWCGRRAERDFREPRPNLPISSIVFVSNSAPSHTGEFFRDIRQVSTEDMGSICLWGTGTFRGIQRRIQQSELQNSFVDNFKVNPQ